MQWPSVVAKMERRGGQEPTVPSYLRQSPSPILTNLCLDQRRSVEVMVIQL